MTGRAAPRQAECDNLNPMILGAFSMYTSFASGTLIVLGVVITVLGFLLAANLLMAIVGLGSVLAGGLLGLAERRVA